MARQTLQPDQWLVCGEDLEGYEFHQGQEVIERKPELSELHSICMNCLEAMKHVKGDKLFVVDDDDWIRDDYLAVMDSALDMADLVGASAPAFYFHVGSRKWRNMKNHAHCSLGQTGFTSRSSTASRPVAEIKHRRLDRHDAMAPLVGDVARL